MNGEIKKLNSLIGRLNDRIYDNAQKLLESGERCEKLRRDKDNMQRSYRRGVQKKPEKAAQPSGTGVNKLLGGIRGGASEEDTSPVAAPVPKDPLAKDRQHTQRCKNKLKGFLEENYIDSAAIEAVVAWV